MKCSACTDGAVSIRTLSSPARRASAALKTLGEPQADLQRTSGSERATNGIGMPWSFSSIAVLPPVAAKRSMGTLAPAHGLIQRATATGSASHPHLTPALPPSIRLSAVSQGVVNELVELYDFLPADTPYVFDDLKLIMIQMTGKLLWMERAALSAEAEARLILIMADAVNAMWSAMAGIPIRDVQQRSMIGVYEKWERIFDQQLRIEIELKRAKPAPEREDPTRWYA